MLQIAAALAGVEELLHQADSHFIHASAQTDDDSREDAARFLQKAVVHLLVLLDLLRAQRLYGAIEQMIHNALPDPLAAAVRFDRDYLQCCSALKNHVAALRIALCADSAPASSLPATSKEPLASLVARSMTLLCDTRLFSSAPKNESELQHRIEAVLRCCYPEVLSDPAPPGWLQWRPGSGVPALQTLIDYRFIASQDAVTRTVAQLKPEKLAAQYDDPQWVATLFVFFQTYEVCTEAQWRNMLRLSEGQSLVLLTAPPA